MSTGGFVEELKKSVNASPITFPVTKASKIAL
jgi:hypothetical protein